MEIDNNDQLIQVNDDSLNNNNSKKVKKSVSKIPEPNKDDSNKAPKIPTLKCGCKKLDLKTHSLCSKNCSCNKNGNKCSSKCHCKGICSNGKSISDTLFFKVWRNIVLRNHIIGDENLETIRVKNQFLKEIIEILDNNKINFNLDFINQFVKLYGRKSNPEITFEYVLEECYKVERENRLNEFKNYFINFNNGADIDFGIGLKYLYRGCNSYLIKNYVNAVLLEDKLKLPSIDEIIIEELENIEIIIQKLKYSYEIQGLVFIINNNNKSKEFISHYLRGNLNLELLLKNEHQLQTKLKRRKFKETFKKIGLKGVVLSDTIKQQIELYSNSFMDYEFIFNNIWSFNKIISTVRNLNVPKMKENRTNTIRKSFDAENYILRNKSEIVNKYINNIPLQDITITLSTSETITIYNEDNRERNESVYIDEPTIEQVIQSERKSIESLLRDKVEPRFKYEGLPFNENCISLKINNKSNSIINFIKATGGTNVNMEQLLTSLVKEEILELKKEKKHLIEDAYKKNEIKDIIYPHDRDKFINTVIPREISKYKVLSLEQLIEKELKVKESYQSIIKELKEKKIKIRRNLYHSITVQDYLRKDTYEVRYCGSCIPSFEKVIQFEIDYAERKKLLKSKLKEIGIYRKGSLVLDNKISDDNDRFIYYYLLDLVPEEFKTKDQHNHSSDNKIQFDQVINYEIQRWKNDKGDNYKSDEDEEDNVEDEGDEEYYDEDFYEQMADYD